MDVGKLPAKTLKRLLGNIRQHSNVLVGANYGEDAAAVCFGDKVLVATSDPITFATDRIGYYSVCINANDVAVMGAEPRFFLATVLLPEGSSEQDAEDVFRQIADACESMGVALVGGHTEITSTVERIVVSGTMLGEADQDSLVSTSNASVGDMVVLIGGIAIEGTSILAREVPDELLKRGVSQDVIERAQRFIDDPGICVLRYARIARETGGVTAMHDPTEGGLASALCELAEASGCGITTCYDTVNVLPECRIICDALDIDPWGLIASGSLLVTVASDYVDPMLGAFTSHNVPVRVIGRMSPASEGLKLRDGRELPRFERDEIARFFEEHQ